MAYRFTNTEKWNDSWFSNLSQIEMLLFLYLCDNCDIAGFTEINIKRWSSDLNSNPGIIQGALKGLQRGLIISNDGEVLYLRNFLKHQKNLPLNPSNKAHFGVLKRFEIYKYKFDIEDISEFISSSMKGAIKGLQSPTGNGNGNGIGNGNEIKAENEKKIDIYTFDEFWDDYDKKVGDKANLIKKWANISDNDKLLIKEYIPKYKTSQPDKKYRKNPEKFLNNKSWNDELVEYENLKQETPKLKFDSKGNKIEEEGNKWQQ